MFEFFLRFGNSYQMYRRLKWFQTSMRVSMQNGTDILLFRRRIVENGFFGESKYSMNQRIRSIDWSKNDISNDKKDFCSNSARCLHQSENVPARCLCLGADSSITFGSQCQYSLPLIAILFISSLCIFIIVIIAAFIIKVRTAGYGLPDVSTLIMPNQKLKNSVKR